MLREQNLQNFLPGRQLSAKVAAQMVRRADALADAGDTAAGWRDLERAALLEGESELLCRVRERLVAQAIAEVERYLEADDPRAALARLDRLARRHEASDVVRTLRQVAGRLAKGKELCRRGKFAEADVELAAGEALRPDLACFRDRRERCRLNLLEARRLQAALHSALAKEDWPSVLEAADALLELAPDNAQARSARHRAWAAVGLKATRTGLGGPRGFAPDLSHRSTNPILRSAKVDTVASPSAGAKFLMWIDAVGGFLVCLGDEIVLGPPMADAAPDVPILGDLSRHHAVIRRDGEGYLIEPVRSVKLDGRPLSGITSLADGNIIELGEGVEFRFRRPHALSATARLEPVSGHKTEPSVDAVLLMAESCVLGPGWHSHVVCRDWQHDLVLFRRGDELFCRTSGTFDVDDREQTEQSRLTTQSRIEGEDFALTLEEL